MQVRLHKIGSKRTDQCLRLGTIPFREKAYQFDTFWTASAWLHRVAKWAE